MGSTSSFLAERLQKEKKYWLSKLSGELGASGIPVDFKRPEVLSEERARTHFKIAPDTRAKLVALCGNNSALAFAAFITALKLCLRRYSGAEDIIVGTAIHSQHKDSTLLNKVLALRDSITGELTAKQVLRGVKQTLAEAYSNQKYPFDDLLKHLNIERYKNRSPLFSVAILLENIGKKENLEQLNTDATLYLALEGQEIMGHIEYSPELFKRETIEVFSEHYQRVLRMVLDLPDTPISQLRLLSEQKREKLVFDFNSTESDYPKHQTIHSLFERQVERTPDGVAIEFRGVRVNYRELNEQANRLARHLRALGVKPGAQVGIYLEHSPRLIVAILAILKAGGAYVPLDPGHPRARLDFIIKDSEIEIMVTERELAGGLTGFAGETVLLDAEVKETGHSLEGSSASQELAYVIYTSGSTGEPKGVKVQHSALVNYVWWAKDIYLRGETAAFALYSSLAFDLTVTSIFTPLITGNLIIIYPRDEAGASIYEVLAENRAEILKLTPSHLALIRGRNNGASRIKRLIVGGEAFETELARAVSESFHRDVEIFNEYGPTEATVGCMTHKYDAASDNRAFIPIGRPAANAQIYVLDSDRNPVAENETGEIFISGDALAQGYLNRPELTADRFVDNPFARGKRMYRTGDLARFLPEGLIEYVGRKDQQVKFHGHRVELEEIRSALNRHPQIRDSVVIMTKDGGGFDSLVAYYVSRQELPGPELRAFLAESVIEKTIPNFFIHLKRLPLTLNGKVNYRALPPIDEARKKLSRSFEAPRTPLEEILAGILAQVLAVESVGIHDNFFELGGHSLLAAQFISQVRESLQIELPLRTIFESHTIASLSQRVQAIQRTGEGLKTPPIQHASRKAGILLSFQQQRMWLHDQSEPSSAANNTPLALQYTGPIDVEVLEKSLNEIVRRHEALRTTFSIEQGRPVQVIQPQNEIELPIIDLTGMEESDRESQALRIATEEGLEPFDLSRGPLLRAKLLRLAEDEHILLLLMHHIAIDPWSLSVLLRELAILYDAFSNGKPSPLPELTIQYADYAAWQRQWLQGETLEALLSYWKRQLGGKIQGLNLPTDYSRPEVETYKGAIHPFELTKDLTQSLKAFSYREAVTPFMTLLSAFKSLLYCYSRQQEVIITSTIANRSQLETESLIGFFANTIPLRTSFSGDPTFKEILLRVRDVVLGAYTHQAIPFDVLVKELGLDQGEVRGALSKVIFSLLTVPMPQSDRPFAKPRLRYVDTGIAEVDLSLRLWEEKDVLLGNALYKTDLFSADTISELVKNYQSLLQKLIANPEIRLSEILPLTRTVERDEGGQINRSLYQISSISASAQDPALIGQLDNNQKGFRVVARAKPLPETVMPDANSDLPSHLFALPGRRWAFWRWVGLRGAGFPIAQVLELSDIASSQACDLLLEAEENVRLAREQAVGAVSAILGAPGHDGRGPDAETRGDLLNALRMIKRGKRPQAVDQWQLAEVKSYFAACDQLNELRLRFDKTFAEGRSKVSAFIDDLIHREQFREAIIWQNRHALHGSIEALSRTSSAGKRNAERRKREEVIASYWQRYCAKNDTIGFFGPVGWARIDSSAETIRVRPGQTLLAARNIYFEGWCMDALAKMLDKDKAIKPWIAPRLNPLCHFDGVKLRLAQGGIINLSQKEAIILDRCDGERTAKEIAQELVKTGSDMGEDSIYAVLNSLKNKGFISWALEAPIDIRPERKLREIFERIGDDKVRKRVLGILNELEQARDAVAEAAGDAEALDSAMANMESVFTRLTGASSTRSHGQFYAGRTLVYEDCVRDIEVDLGSKLIASLGRPLSLLLDGARWFAAQAAAAYAREFNNIYDDLSHKAGTRKVEFVNFWHQARRLDTPENSPIGDLALTFQKAWSEIFSIPKNAHQVNYTSEELEPRVAQKFSTQAKSWSNARYHSPDVMIAASSAEAIRRGDYQFVLGELHMAINTLGFPAFLEQHPCPEEIFSGYEQDMIEPRLVPIVNKYFSPEQTARVFQSLVSPKDFWLEVVPGFPDTPKSRTIPLSALIVERQEGALLARTRDGSLQFDIMKVFETRISYIVVDSFKVLIPGRHNPRITIDRLVVSRESWKLSPPDIEFADLADDSLRFREARRWARSNGMPRFVFVRITTEEKPFFVDFNSPIYIDIFSKVIRKSKEIGGDKTVISITEMLPSPDHVWLPDGEGNKYACELRFVALDLNSSDESDRAPASTLDAGRY